MAKVTETVIELSIALVVIAVLLGRVAVPIFLNVSTTGMDSTQAAIWPVLLTIAFVAILLAIIRSVRGK